jgi:hypothetical protein
MRYERRVQHVRVMDRRLREQWKISPLYEFLMLFIPRPVFSGFLFFCACLSVCAVRPLTPHTYTSLFH